MARATSLNAEIEINGETIYPSEIGEIGEGEEGRIDVADGSRKYKVRDQIFDIGEIPLTVLWTKDRKEVDLLQDFCIKGLIQDVYVKYRDSAGKVLITYLLTNTECAMGKKNAFNRQSKEVDTKKYVLLPEFIQEII